MNKYKTGLVIGRFQPFHKGHLYLLRESLRQVDQIIVAIGSINVHSDDNPFSQSEVEKMIDEVLKKENWEEKLVQIFGVPDFHDDEKWLSFIQKHSQKYDVVISHNDWVTRIFRQAKTPVIEIPFYRRDIYEGKKIRDLMRNGGDWSKRLV